MYMLKAIMNNFKTLCDVLEAKIKSSYEDGVTLENAEKLAGEFLYAQLQVSGELRKADLDSRMRKSGLKAIKATVYIESASKGDKKPTEAMLAATVDKNEVVQKEQDSLDTAEVDKAELERFYSIFQNAHIYYRGIAKGKFD